MITAVRREPSLPSVCVGSAGNDARITGARGFSGTNVQEPDALASSSKQQGIVLCQGVSSVAECCAAWLGYMCPVSRQMWPNCGPKSSHCLERRVPRFPRMKDNEAGVASLAPLQIGIPLF